MPMEGSLNFNENDSFNSILITTIFIGTFSYVFYLNYHRQKKIKFCKAFDYSQINQFKNNGCVKIPELKKRYKMLLDKTSDKKKLDSCLKIKSDEISRFQINCKKNKYFQKEIDAQLKKLKNQSKKTLEKDNILSKKILKCLSYKKYSKYEADNCDKFKETKDHYKKLLKKKIKLEKKINKKEIKKVFDQKLKELEKKLEKNNKNKKNNKTIKDKIKKIKKAIKKEIKKENKKIILKMVKKDIKKLKKM